jgi:hypothetical protein
MQIVSVPVGLFVPFSDRKMQGAVVFKARDL